MISKISFGNTMVVTGNQKQLIDISSEISRKSGISNSEYVNGKTKPNYHFDDYPIDGQTPTKKVLYATKKDGKKLTEIYAKTSNIKDKSLKDLNIEFIKNCKKAFGDSIEYKAKEVLSAIKSGRFDFKNLRIKK